MKYLLLLSFSLVLFACQPNEKEKTTNNQSIPESTEQEQPKTDADMPEETEEEALEKDAPEEDEMKFMPPIEANSYYGFQVGQKTDEQNANLVLGELTTGEGTFQVHFMRYKNDTLGYVFAPRGTIKSIHIWDKRGATLKGVRPGSTFGELKRFLPNYKVHGSELEGRVHVYYKDHMYRLKHNNFNFDLDESEIPDSVEVTEVIIKG